MVNKSSSSRHSSGSVPGSTAVVSSSVHVVITAMLGIIATALSCFAFYVFRSMTTREKTFGDALKAIRSATEIVSSLAERGVPVLRGRIDELETKNRMLEQSQRRTGSVVEKLASVVSSVSTQSGVAPLSVSSTVNSDPIASEAAMLAARRAARAATQAPGTATQ